MPDLNKDEESKNPHEDSMVTSNHLGGKKVDADPDNEAEQPADENNLITEASQKGKKVDADPEEESDKPSAE
jgi:hypothetical protein